MLGKIGLGTMLISAGLCAGCGVVQQIAMSKANETARAAVESCKQRKVAGIFRSEVEVARCAASQITAVLSQAGYRRMDLVELLDAAMIASAERVDRGQETAAQANLDLAELMVRLGNEERQGNLAAAQAGSDALARWGESLQSIGNANRGLNCTTTTGPTVVWTQPRISTTNCY